MANDINIRIGAKLDGLQRGIKKAQGQLSRFANFAETTGRDLTTRLSLPIIGVGAAAVNTFAQFEKTKLGLTALYQSAEVAETVFNRLQDVVKDTRTTLDLKSASTAALQLKSVGVEGERAINIIKQLGIATTVSGASADDFGEVTRQLSQTIAAGKILETELKIIKQRVPGLAGILNAEFGAVTAAGLNDQGIGVNEFVDRLTKAIETSETYQSVQGGLSKAIETFGINLQIAGAEIGEVISKTLNLPALIEKVSGAISKVAEKFKNLPPDLQSAIVKTAAFAAALGPLLLGLGALAKVQLLASGGLTLLTGTFATFLKGPLLGLIGGFKSFGAVIFGTTKAVGPFALQIGGVSKVIGVLFSGIKAILNPISLLISGFTAGYARSQTFRDIVGKLADTLKGVASGALSIFGGSLEGIGKIGLKVVGALAGIVSIIGNLLNSVVSFVSGVAGGISALSNGDVFGALRAVEKGVTEAFSITPIEDFKKVYDEVVNGVTSTKVEAPKIELPSGLASGSSSGSTDLGGTSASVSNPYSVYNEPAESLISNLVSISEQAQRTGTSLREMAASSGLQSELSKSVEDLGLKIQATGNTTQSVSDGIFTAYGEKIAAITNQSLAFGGSFDAIGAKITATKEAIQAALDEGYSPYSDTIVALQEKLLGLRTELTSLNEEEAARTERMSAAADAISTFGNAIASMAEQGSLSLRKFAQAALSAIADVIGALIKQGVAAAISGSLTSAPGPIGLALAGAAGAIASGILKGAINKITAPKLKDGGIIPPGYSGDKFPAFLNSGEAVIPIDRLMDAVASGGGSGQFILRGADLVTAYDRASYNRVRVTGN